MFRTPIATQSGQRRMSSSFLASISRTVKGSSTRKASSQRAAEKVAGGTRSAASRPARKLPDHSNAAPVSASAASVAGERPKPTRRPSAAVPEVSGIKVSATNAMTSPPKVHALRNVDIGQYE